MVDVKPIARLAWKWIKNNSTKLLTAGAIVSQIAGYYFMHKEAPIVHEKLKELPEDANWWTKVKTAGPIYLPAAAMLVIGSASTIGVCAAGERKAAVMASLYSASDALVRKYEQEIVEHVGKEKAQEIHNAVAQDLLNDPKIQSSEIICTGKGDIMFFDPWTGRRFRSSLDAVKNDISDFNNFVTHQCWATMNDFYECLGVDKAKCGDMFGFNLDNKLVIAFDEGSDPKTKELCWVLRYCYEPVLWNGKPAKEFRCCEDCYID